MAGHSAAVGNTCPAGAGNLAVDALAAHNRLVAGDKAAAVGIVHCMDGRVDG